LNTSLGEFPEPAGELMEFHSKISGRRKSPKRREGVYGLQVKGSQLEGNGFFLVCTGRGLLNKKINTIREGKNPGKSSERSHGSKWVRMKVVTTIGGF